MPQLSETTINIILGVLIVLVLVMNIYMRRRRMEKEPLGKVVFILSDLDKNYKQSESFSFHKSIKRFRTGAWRRNKDKVVFLPSELHSTLSKSFGVAEEFNQRIDSAKKSGSDSYMAGIDIGKLKSPTEKARQDLRAWLQENMNKPEFAQKKRRGLFGSF